MTQPVDPNQPPPPPAYGTAPPPPPPPYGAPPPGYPPPPPVYAGAQGYGPIPGQRINDPAPMGMRLLARIIDWVIVGAVLGVVIAAFGIHIFHHSIDSQGVQGSIKLNTSSYLKVVLLGILFTGVYEVGMLTAKGATVGKMAVGVRVAMLENGAKPTLGAAAIRWAIPAVSSVVPTGLLALVMWLSPFFDSTHRNRGWYDYAAKTIAVRTR